MVMKNIMTITMTLNMTLLITSTLTLSLILEISDEEDNCRKQKAKDVTNSMKKITTTTKNTGYLRRERQSNRLSISRHPRFHSGRLFASLNRLTLLILNGTLNLTTETALRQFMLQHGALKKAKDHLKRMMPTPMTMHMIKAGKMATIRLGMKLGLLKM